VPFYEGIQHLKKTGDAIQWGGERLCENGQCATPDGRAHFKVVPLPPSQPASDPRNGARLFHVSTRRGKQFNTLIHKEIDPLTGAGRDAVFMHPEDAAELHLAGGDRVVLLNDTGRLEGRVFPVCLARGNLQVHWPEGNVLIPRGVVDPVGGVPDYNAMVRVERL